MRSEGVCENPVKEWAELHPSDGVVQELLLGSYRGKAFVYTAWVDGRQMELLVVIDSDREVCGHRSIEMFYECRLWPGHDGLHFPFTKELLRKQPDLVVASMRSA